MRFLGDVLKKNIDLNVITMFEKIWNIVLTMHISNVFGKKFK